MIYIVIDTIPKRADVSAVDLPLGVRKGDELSPAFVANNPELLDRLLDSGMVKEVANQSLYGSFPLFV
jgi:hypothetical protein